MHCYHIHPIIPQSSKVPLNFKYILIKLVMMVVQSYEYVQNQSLVFFKTVSFMLHELFRYEKKICCV